MRIDKPIDVELQKKIKQKEIPLQDKINALISMAKQLHDDGVNVSQEMRDLLSQL